MRGRLRVYEGDAGDKATWAKVPGEFWSKILDGEVPVIPVPKLAPEAEIPTYGDDSIYFSIKLHHGGEFDENLDGYIGGKVSYFDNCSVKEFGVTDMESMVTEIGLVLGEFCLWFCIPDTEFVKGLLPVVTKEEVESLLYFVLYSKCLHLYTTSTEFDISNDFGDFSFTQLEEDDRIERIEAIREECDYVGEGEAEPELGQNKEEAKSTTAYHFKINMDALKKLAPRAHDWLAAKPKSQWSRYAFRDTCKSDMFVNNNCEVFNNAINKFREMGIVTMLKSIHNTCMDRVCKRLTRMEHKDTVFCTKPLKKLHKSMEMAARARPSWNGGSKFLVTMTDGGNEIVVDLQNKSCACRKWQLTGIPCFHACSYIFFLKQSPLDYMHGCHKKEWYLRVYSHIIEPLNREEFWDETYETSILPPKARVAPGRPKKKRDKRSDVVPTRENNPNMLKRTGTSLKCTWCLEWGHNTRTCNTKRADEERKRMEEPMEEGAGPSNVAGGRKCTICQQFGHNKRTCTGEKVENVEKIAKKPANKPSFAKLQEPVHPPHQHSSPQENVCATNNSSHGGIIRPFKPPGRQCLCVDSVPGQKYTSLKNLEDAARLKKQKLGKKN